MRTVHIPRIVYIHDSVQHSNVFQSTHRISMIKLNIPNMSCHSTDHASTSHTAMGKGLITVTLQCSSSMLFIGNIIRNADE